jgi:hypothetical protein
MRVHLSLFILPWRLSNFGVFPTIDDFPLVFDEVWCHPLISVDPEWDFVCFDHCRFLRSLSVIDTGSSLFALTMLESQNAMRHIDYT